MLRLFDENCIDITDELDYCDNPSCLGEPWCSAWGICSEQEGSSVATGPSGRSGTAAEASGESGLDQEVNIDALFTELSQQLATGEQQVC